jgi:hypothetical protein
MIGDANPMLSNQVKGRDTEIQTVASEIEIKTVPLDKTTRKMSD